MKKIITLIVIIVALLAVLAWWLWPEASSPSSMQKNDNTSASSAQERVIDEARKYAPDGICATVITPAVHTETGAHYTFPSSCLPPGWHAGHDAK